jgi:DNA-binding response OmpR family regulator
VSIETLAHTSGETVLVVEDNPSLQEYLLAILQPRFNVLLAENGQEALQQLAQANSLPSLIVSDVMMPLMDGFQLLSQLKGSDAYRLIPVIMLTARADKADKLRALRIGVDDYLLKPFDEDELLARITTLLTNQRERQRYVLTESDAPIDREESLATLPVMSADDLAWLEKLETVVLAQLSNADLTAEALADELAASRSTLFREVKRLTGLTPTQYITEARFQRARQLLERREVSSVKQLAAMVGFRQVKHFSASYKNQFGKSPSDYL